MSKTFHVAQSRGKNEGQQIIRIGCTATRGSDQRAIRTHYEFRILRRCLIQEPADPGNVAVESDSLSIRPPESQSG